MTPVFCCGFECGVTTALHWLLSASASFSTSTVRNGARSLRCNPAAASTGNANNTCTSSGLFVTRFYLNFTSLPTSDCGIAAFIPVTATGRRPGICFLVADSKLYPTINTISAGVGTGVTGISVTTGVWYRIDLKVDLTGGTFSSTFSVDGSTDVSISGAVSADTSTTIRLGTSSTTTMDVFYDDFILSNTLADYPIGPGYVNHFVPTSDGTHNVAGTADFQRTLTGVDILNATTTAFQLIDDVPLESGASVDWINMIAPPNAADYVECVFGAAPGIGSPGLPPRAAEFIAGIHQAATGTGNMEIRIRDNGSTNTMYSATTVAGVTSVAYKRVQYATAPTGGAWKLGVPSVFSNANFNNIRVQFGSPGVVDVNPDQYLDCIMMEAEFPYPIPKPVLINQSLNRAANW